MSQCVGVDVSESMVELYNAKAKSQVSPNDCFHHRDFHVPTSENAMPCQRADHRPRGTQGFTPEQRAAHVGNLLDPSDASPSALSDAQFSNFDVAGVGAGFHHFDDAHLAAARLAQRLRPDGGVLFILDFVAHEADPDHGATKGVRHHGFTEAQMRDVFERAGVGRGFEFRVMDEDVVFENARGVGKHMTRRVFFARGERA